MRWQRLLRNVILLDARVNWPAGPGSLTAAGLRGLARSAPGVDSQIRVASRAVSATDWRRLCRRSLLQFRRCALAAKRATLRIPHRCRLDLPRNSGHASHSRHADSFERYLVDGFGWIHAHR